MTMEMSDLVRPQLEKFVSMMDAPSAALVRPAIENALDGIESICPVVMIPTRRGVATAYGPQFHGDYAMIVASAEKYLAVSWDNWLDPLENVPPHGAASLWKVMADFLRDGKAGEVMECVMCRIGDASADTKATLDELRSKDVTPILMVLVWSEKTKACGVIGIALLPGKLEDQIARAEKAA